MSNDFEISVMARSRLLNNEHGVDRQIIYIRLVCCCNIIALSCTISSYRKTSNTSPRLLLKTNALDPPACIGDPACIRDPACIKTSDLKPPACIGDSAYISDPACIRSFTVLTLSNIVTLESGLGSLTVLGNGTCDRLHTSSYSSPILTMPIIYFTVFEERQFFVSLVPFNFHDHILEFFF